MKTKTHKDLQERLGDQIDRRVTKIQNFGRTCKERIKILKEIDKIIQP